MKIAPHIPHPPPHRPVSIGRTGADGATFEGLLTARAENAVFGDLSAVGFAELGVLGRDLDDQVGSDATLGQEFVSELPAQPTSLGDLSDAAMPSIAGEPSVGREPGLAPAQLLQIDGTALPMATRAYAAPATGQTATSPRGLLTHLQFPLAGEVGMSPEEGLLAGRDGADPAPEKPPPGGNGPSLLVHTDQGQAHLAAGDFSLDPKAALEFMHTARTLLAQAGFNLESLSVNGEAIGQRNPKVQGENRGRTSR